MVEKCCASKVRHHIDPDVASAPAVDILLAATGDSATMTCGTSRHVKS